MGPWWGLGLRFRFEDLVACFTITGYLQAPFQGSMHLADLSSVL